MIIANEGTKGKILSKIYKKFALVLVISAAFLYNETVISKKAK